MTNHLLCCDWGTSQFRLQLIRSLDYECVGEISSAEGVAATFDGWRKSGRANGVEKADFFRQQLKRQVETLTRNVKADLAEVPILISGMASSSIGMEEVPYAELPFALDGSGASVRYADAHADFPHDILLISGVRSPQDVMRGEETQLIGLLILLDQADAKAKRSIFIFPGTHSKHMTVEEGYLTHFDTYMTGELFDLMVNRSILHDSVDAGSLVLVGDGDVIAFRRGVQQAMDRPVLNSLFTVRTNGLFGKLTKRHNALYLSGLLIGSELERLRDKPDWPIVLCSGSRLSDFYQLALDELRLLERTTVVSPDLIDRAASAGQIQLYQYQSIKQTTE